MSRFLNYLKYSGIWAGVVINPLHWEFRCVTGERKDPVFENCIIFGPVWLRVVIDDGEW